MEEEVIWSPLRLLGFPFKETLRGGPSCIKASLCICFHLKDAKYYSEEAEVDLQDPNKDYELYKHTCQDLQRLMAEIQELKSKGSKDSVRLLGQDRMCVVLIEEKLWGENRCD